MYVLSIRSEQYGEYTDILIMHNLHHNFFFFFFLNILNRVQEISCKLRRTIRRCSGKSTVKHQQTMLGTDGIVVNCISSIKVEVPFFLKRTVKVFLKMCLDRAVEMNSPLFHVIFTVFYVMHELQIMFLC